jgi:tRNA(fMet)-specific endonuclease VapC
VTVEIAELAGRIEGEQAALGVSIAFEDLLIGARRCTLATAWLGTTSGTSRLIPGLAVVRV